MGRRNYIMDITKHAFEAKRKHFEIKDEDLEKAAQYAIMEANDWRDAAKVLKEENYSRQTCVLLLYSTEIYLKAIFMQKGINITNKENKKQFGHNIYNMYEKLDDSEKNRIKSNVDLPVEYTDLAGDRFKEESFEKMLEFVSNDFVNLRYNYEKYVNGEPIYVFIGFILAVNENCQKLAESIINQK